MSTPNQNAKPAARIAPLILLAVLPAATLVALLGLLLTNELGNTPAIVDPGPVITWARPIVRTLHDVAAALTVGMLVLAAWALPGVRRDKLLSPVQRYALRWASVAAGVWAGSALASLIVSVADITGSRLSSPGLPSLVARIATTSEFGQSLLAVAFFAGAASLAASRARTPATMAWAAAAGLLALVPLALSGHASGSDDHSNAVNALGVHLLSVTVWSGGLVGLIILAPRLGPTMGQVSRRYSALALWAFIGVAASGVVNSAIRLREIDNLTTPYGWLIIAKTVLLIALGLAGWSQRRRTLPRLDISGHARRAFIRLAVTEVLIMAAAMGLSVALSSSAPPGSQLAPGEDAAQRALLGFPMPPPLTIERWLTTWNIDLLWLSVAVIGSAWYLRAAHRVRMRGDRWPVLRDVSFVLGCGLLVWITGGAPAVYGETSFSGHMLQHMGLMMFVPPFIVASAPLLLALRSTRARTDGSRGAREWLLAIFRSRYSHFLTRPAVAGVLFAGSMVAFYYSPAFEFALRSHLGHMLMCVHFLLTGYLFTWVIIGIDPGAGRASYPFRLMMMLITLTFHAFFGLALMTDVQVLAPSWWSDLGLRDTEALLADQHIGGGVAWGAGELPTVVIAIILGYLWQKDDRKETIRRDRQADRDGDAELAAYNARLERLADHAPGFHRP